MVELASSVGIGGVFGYGGCFNGLVDVAREVLVADDGGAVGGALHFEGGGRA